LLHRLVGSTQESIDPKATFPLRARQFWAGGGVMQVLYPCCCGLDIHKKFVVACLMTTNAEGHVQKESRTFSTMTHDLLAMLDWLQAAGCTHVAMESTSSY